MLVLQQPKWDGKSFKCPELSENIKSTKYEMLIPIVLTEERQIYLIHLDPIRLCATIYVAQQYETNSHNSIDELSPSDIITIDNAFDVDP